MTHRSKLAALATALLGTILFVPAALAVDDTNVTVTGGSLAMTNPLAVDFDGVTLDGTAKTSTAVLGTFSATDSTGSGSGWNLTVQATQFKEYAGAAYIASGKTLPTSSLTLPLLTVAQDGTTSAVPTMTGSIAIDTGSAVKFASAAISAGMGKYDFGLSGTQTLSLNIPADSYAKSYRSDVTFSAVTGP